MTHIRSSVGTGPRVSRKSGGARRARAAAALLAAGGLSAWALAATPAFAATGHPAQSPSAASAKAAKGQAAKTDDFNGDGYADVVAGAPGGTVSGKATAGYVVVTYGSASGLSPAHKSILSRSTSGVPGTAAAKEQFGSAFSKGDLDGDGYSDLVIGSGKAGLSSVILWGSPTGLTGGTEIKGYGQTPTVGDFDGDGKADLALFGDPGSYGDDPPAQPAALWKGPVSRTTGQPAGKLNFLDKSEWWGYDDNGAACADDDSCINGPHSVAGPVIAKATGDVNGDGREDIVAGVYDGDGMWQNHVLLGSPDGFTHATTEGYGGAVGVGDVDGDGYDDVVVGANDATSKVTIDFGSADYPKQDREQTFDQTLPGFYGAQEKGDDVGSCVSVADVTGDGKADVLLGISGEDFSGLTNAGSFALLHGTSTGVTGSGSQVVHQNTAGVPGVAETGDKFGAACTLADTNGDGHRDIAVSSSAENDSAGALWSFNGTASGLTTTGATAFGPADLGATATKALFGSTLR
ncbi:FG-GAP-like repeat-containing protein [Streptomyces sp. NPDC059740]|uniref:FG-GAP-like repeat-containing protein n=1 Tax=Streptomyces sp. NPDC059740 TaxID=3346926 RepID=UPI003666B06F